MAGKFITREQTDDLLNRLIANLDQRVWFPELAHDIRTIVKNNQSWELALTIRRRVMEWDRELQKQARKEKRKK